MPKIKICKEEGCKNSQTTDGFCRLHYLKNWKKLQTEKKKKSAKNLNRYVESILKKHPDRYIEVIKKDLRSKKFDQFVDDEFGETGVASPFEAGTYDEDIESFLTDIKIHREF